MKDKRNRVWRATRQQPRRRSDVSDARLGLTFFGHLPEFKGQREGLGHRQGHRLGLDIGTVQDKHVTGDFYQETFLSHSLKLSLDPHSETEEMCE